jgi:hypothetical protein
MRRRRQALRDHIGSAGFGFGAAETAAHTPMIIGTSDSRMMPTTSSDRFFLMNGTLPKK